VSTCPSGLGTRASQGELRWPLQMRMMRDVQHKAEGTQGRGRQRGLRLCVARCPFTLWPVLQLSLASKVVLRGGIHWSLGHRMLGLSSFNGAGIQRQDCHPFIDDAGRLGDILAALRPWPHIDSTLERVASLACKHTWAVHKYTRLTSILRIMPSEHGAAILAARRLKYF